jgi:hypothetical protein
VDGDGLRVVLADDDVLLREGLAGEGTVEKHVRSILAKLNLAETDDDHRRVLAVVTFLEAR